MNDVINNHDYDFAIKFWGDWACFTRPELKVERMTYPVMTPSAARGALEAIFWKPEMRWEVREIWILRKMKEISIMRNEINDRQSPSIENFITDDEKRRAQRTSLFLKEPSYLVFADIRVKPSSKTNKAGYIAQIKRRLEKGRCFHQPYLGTRECTAFFREANDEDRKECQAIDLEVGNMLFDTAYCRIDKKNNDSIQFITHKKGDEKNIRDVVWGVSQHIFFDANIENGRLVIPKEKYDELYRLEGFDV
jgi:CRISPR-associated protein Cas5d